MGSLRAKIIIFLLLLSTFLSVALTISTYGILNRSLFAQLRARVSNLTQAGALLLDRDALAALAARVKPNLTEGEVLAIERSAPYRVVSDQLNEIRSLDARLVRYVYTFVPGDGPETARYLVDADVLQLLGERASGKEVADDEISSFASDFDVSEYPVAREVLATGKPLVEKAYSYDDVFKVNSVSGYAPMYDAGGKRLIAVIGLDMVDSDVRSELRSATLLSAAAGGVALLVTALVSVVLGTFFTRGIVELDRVVRKFSVKNLGVRAAVRSRDEVGRLGMSFNQMAEIIERYNDQQLALLSAYGRFVPHDFLRFLEKDSIVDVQLGDQVQREMTVLFSDIRSFTALSETMTPRENFNFLNSYLNRVGPEIRGHGGFIDKYIGDAIMALFPGEPDDALRAAIAMQGRVVEYNGHRSSSGYPAISVGIGIHTGKLMLGTLGEQERMDGSVIADAVNLCSRLESLTRIYGGTTLVSGQTLSLLGNRSAFHTRFMDRVLVRGRKESVLIYEVYDGDAPDVAELKAATKPDWNAAVKLYYAREFAQSLEILRALHVRCPEDHIFEIYIRRCERLLQQGVPESWRGVEIIDMK